MLRITSRHNVRLREAARLIASSRDRRKAGRCVLEGEHIVAVYAERYGAPATLIATEEALVRPPVRALADRYPELTIIVPASLFAELATLPAGVGVLAVVPTPQSSTPTFEGLCLLLEDVQDPGNVGSILRSAAAAGVAQVLLSKHCAFAWSPKVLRAGQGAHFCVAIHEDIDLPAWATVFAARGGDVIATVPSGGGSLYEAPLAGPIALAVGNEGAGLSAELVRHATRRVTIPMHGGVESINAAAAAAVILFECARQRIAAVAATG